MLGRGLVRGQYGRGAGGGKVNAGFYLFSGCTVHYSLTATVTQHSLTGWLVQSIRGCFMLDKTGIAWGRLPAGTEWKSRAIRSRIFCYCVRAQDRVGIGAKANAPLLLTCLSQLHFTLPWFGTRGPKRGEHILCPQSRVIYKNRRCI